MIEDLPLELWLGITDHITHKSDLKSLSEVSQSLHQRTIHLLYQRHDVVLRALDEDDLEQLSVAGILEAAQGPRRCLDVAKGLRVSSPFMRKLQKRCLHHGDDETTRLSYGDETCAEWCLTLRRLGEDVVSILRYFPEGQLRTFEWDMGVCVPAQILGPYGYLSIHQNQIECLRLVTDPNCAFKSSVNFIYDVERFISLRQISWTGLRAYFDLMALRKLLGQNGRSLTELEIGLLRWYPRDGELQPMNPTERQQLSQFVTTAHPLTLSILGGGLGVNQLKFPALVALSLSGMDLTWPVEFIAATVRSPHLRSVILRNCAGWLSFLECLLIPRGGGAHLKLLEVASKSSDADYEAMDRVFANLRELESVHLLLDKSWSTGVNLGYLRGQKTTLRSFVYHSLAPFDHSSMLPDEDPDSKDLGFGNYRYVDAKPRSRLVFQLDLEFIGLAYHPSFLQSLLQPFVAKRCLRVLHIRQSGPWIKRFGSWITDTNDGTKPISPTIAVAPCREFRNEDFTRDGDPRSVDKRQRVSQVFRDFLAWAFGPSGISSLDLVVYGDLSCRGRFADDVVMLHRKPPKADSPAPFELYDARHKRDRVVEELLSRHAKSLQACPVSAMMEN